MNNKPEIAVIGLGYVGLPLAVEFSKKFNTVGFDINENRISELRNGIDSTLEVEPEELNSVADLSFESDIKAIEDSNFYVVTVPTPIDAHKQPDLSPLVSASKSVGLVLSKGDVVVYESTVYPGATEEVCVPILEEVSGLKFNVDFYVGYSPERINPGDKTHRLPTIKKVTSGSNAEIARFIDSVYSQIITAGTFLASSIKVAEASKVIENTQRDINIALINELSLIFEKLNIDTMEVLNAAETKWNFLPFKPGLVGGHCIGVDPYYLTHKAIEVGYHPEIILAGRRLNDNMGGWVADQVVKLMTKKGIIVVDSNILILGMTFKENCPDIRNTKVIDVYSELKEYNCCVDVYDPWINKEELKKEYGIDGVDLPENKKYDAVILAVSHEEFIQGGKNLVKSFLKESSVVYDIKSILPSDFVDGRL